MISKLLIPVDQCMLLIWGSSQPLLLQIVLLYCLFLPLLIFQLHIYYIFLNCPTVLKGSVLFLLFCFLCISVWEDYIDLSSNLLIFSSALSSLHYFYFQYFLLIISLNFHLSVYTINLFFASHLVYYYHQIFLHINYGYFKFSV